MSATKCGDLFSCNDKTQVAIEYKEMIRMYHPDVYNDPNAHAITSKVNQMYAAAIDMISKGIWEISNHLEIKDLHGKKYITKYLDVYNFEMGLSYISDLSITYRYETRYASFFHNAVKQINAIRYSSPEMEREFSRYLPKINYAFETADHRYCLILQKAPDVYRLSDVLRYYKEKHNCFIPDRHVAWIISRLCNLCCFFEHIGISHNALTTDSCFISPNDHSVLILGGWGYAEKLGQPLLGIPRAIYDIMPVKAKGNKCADIGTDLESIKRIGRQVADMDAVPEQIKTFLNCGSSSTSWEEFSKWSNVLDLAYGQRTFIEMTINKSDIYK